MRGIAILSLALLAFCSASQAQNALLADDSWTIASDHPGWQVESVDTADKRVGANSLKIESIPCDGQVGNMSVIINSESNAPLTPDPYKPASCYFLGFWAKLSSSGVSKPPPGPASTR